MSFLRRAISAFLVDASSPLFPLAKRYAWSIPVVTLFGFLASGLEGLGIGLLVPLLSVGLPGSGPAETSGGLGFLMRLPLLLDENMRLPAIAAAILSLALLKAGVQGASAVFIAWLDGKLSHEIRAALAHRLLTVGYPFYHENNPARLLAILGTDSWRASDTIRLFFGMIAAIGAVTVFSILLLLVSWQLFLVVAIGSTIIRVLHGSTSGRLKKGSWRFVGANQVLENRMIRVSNEVVRSVRIFGQEGREQRLFDEASEEVRRSSVVVARLSAIFSSLLEVSLAFLFLAALLAAIALEMSVPLLIAFLALLYRMQPHASAIGRARLEIASLWASVEEVEWLLDPAGKPEAPKGALGFGKLEKGIRFSGVSFRFANRESAAPAINDADFEIRPNVATALLGRSGAGKSTIVNLLCRLIEPTQGRILVDGVDLSQIDPVQWRAGLAIAGQDIGLVDGTVAENIAYGAPDATMADIVEAARRADAHDFISALPQSYECLVGNRGLGLSGGQRQRIGIARALVRRPRLLILDEATNAVDAVSEAAIMSLLDEPMTIILISHRESLLALCEDAIVLEQGRVVEWGPLRTLRDKPAVRGALEKQVLEPAT
ncbi:ABC transporter ATP-binding protein [Devosia nitrariae]|uniref:ABC transporter ATP-binding protein n=1 Tax=Devosia nitrariae TaxID=2071872 RepID=A0ABQ5W0Z9_9HYPH|nr:ABC transporter ATP-binding protein [Devosia nitrariae]GLQ53667.1 ABC transporter ATP-binding protein [Devosia nitrariae]